MLSTIDTVIAFAVIMSLLSLLITILVQMVSAAFSLRGKNLANALSLTFQTIDPKIGEHAHALAAQILSDPIFSDSMLAPKSRGAQHSSDRHLRALHQAQVEIVNTTQALVDKPDDVATKKTLAKAQARAQKAWSALQIPKHTRPWTFLRLGAMHLGSAIRPGEIYRILHEFSALPPAEAISRGIAPVLVQRAHDLLESLTKADQPTEESKKKLEAIVDLAKLFPTESKKAVVDSLGNFGATVERATTQAYDRFQRWFGSAQDRAEQWFQMHVRGVTIFFAIAIALILQLDTAEIFHTLRDRPQLVEALVKAAPGVLEEGDKQPGKDTKAMAKPRQDLKDLKEKIAETGFDLVPGNFLGRWDEQKNIPAEWRSALCRRLHQTWLHFFGIAVTMGLLTLGAPFWFNLLKNLMSLRPAIATLIERRPQSAPALPSAPEKPASGS